MAQVVPLIAVPNQIEAVALNGQSCIIAIYQRSSGLYMDVFSNGRAIILGVLCENLNRIVRNTYLGFLGDFFFYDTQGESDPDYFGLGDRYQLIYIEESELERRRSGT